MFKSEDDVREWLRAASGGRVWWFENKRGGTFGFPDAMVVHEGRAVFLELKIIEEGCLMAHPSQLNVVRELRAAGLGAAFLCGVKEKKSPDGRLILIGPEALERASANKRIGGRHKYKATLEGKKGLFSGSNLYRILDALAGNDFPGSFR